MAYNALDIANKILSKASFSDERYGELISNMKLQKLLYYMQGFHLAYFETPLFEEDIEAWMYGPVVPGIYNQYRGYGNSGISPKSKTVIQLTDEEEKLFNQVFDVYGEYSAIGLMNLTHNESPWTDTPIGAGNVISKDKMKRFFKSRIE
jgi:uncharacterized phage-associated protein